MERPYESVVVFDGVMGEDQYEKEISQIEELLNSHAHVESIERWGKRVFAQPIQNKKKRSGYYCVFNYRAEGSVIGTLERTLRLNTNVVRFLSIVRDSRKEQMREQMRAQENEPQMNTESSSLENADDQETKTDSRENA